MSLVMTITKALSMKPINIMDVMLDSQAQALRIVEKVALEHAREDQLDLLRDRFERWARDNDWPLERAEGRYRDRTTQLAWYAVQAMYP